MTTTDDFAVRVMALGMRLPEQFLAEVQDLLTEAERRGRDVAAAEEYAHGVNDERTRMHQVLKGLPWLSCTHLCGNADPIVCRDDVEQLIDGLPVTA